ncbi:NAD-dependent dehydratase [Stenotrophomonas maltophilia]|uniref:NAD-dependent epimerase/dehydratase family protein n=1 Tax=Stenotrophomonas maltophilia TaxID=40324 RepID=UPI000D4023A7|nr:NAD(P)-dependent oxidoreductase [Stenotrophomonas maltophilia]PSD17180.1 NAD-dependent dehydratase [Stenotrophomonas maltophilia]PSD31863.1 NAD-dependent dehydratase [Stenotrophomonas maltophilia]PZT27413.1 NAD-dependent dehydratase [Stenotrophomonas maltophilia]
MKDCILITGGAGFIGSALSHLLRAEDPRPIVAIDNLHPQVHPKRLRPVDLHEDVNLVASDVCEPDTWDAVMAQWRPSLVVHLAAETGTGQSLSEASRHTHVNVTGTARMLDAFAAAGHVPDRIVLTSSRAVYGEGLWENEDGLRFQPGQRSKRMLDQAQWDFPGATPIPFRADVTPPNPTSIYGATKLAQEHIINAWALSFGTEVATLRLQNVYGAGQSLDNPYTGIVSLFARLAKAKQSIPLYEDGLMRRDFVYISDVARAVFAATKNSAAAGRVYDIGYGLPSTIKDLADEVARHYGAPAPHVCGKYRNGDVRHAGCDVSRSLELGWSPEVTMSQGVAQLCDWIDARLSGEGR